MKKNMFYLLLIASFLNRIDASSQVSGTAVYKLQIVFDDETLEVDKKFGFIQKAIDVSELIEYNLIFKGNESNFYQKKDESIDKQAVKMANILSDTPKLSYQNIESKTLLYDIDADGILSKNNEFIISDTLKVDWTITGETKLIDNYLCYRATTLKTIKKVDKVINETVTAWFCPTLPFSFGPTKYAGLPGLIVELKEKNIAFNLTSFVLDTENSVSIKIPSAKKTITQSEYYDIINERMDLIKSLSKQ